VQWKDEVGKGTLDDSGPKPIISVTPAEDPSTSTLPRSASFGGSESEWEDEKTEDSLSLSFTASARRDMKPSRSSIGKRPRASRLEPLFLKSKGFALDSLAEGEEPASPIKRTTPLADRSLNQLPTPDDSSSAGSSAASSSLHVPKERARQGLHGSPARRGPSTPHVAGMASKTGRRRSNIGPLRIEKARRRSSLIPKLSPLPREHRRSVGSGARRVPAASEAEMSMRLSPAKRAKRSSILEGPRSFRLKTGVIANANPFSNLSCVGSDSNASADMSLRSSKPTWR
jgi:kinesin family protein 18/19